MFQITTDDELVISANANGRTVYTNANKTKRTGLELSIDTQYANNISTYFSYSLLNAKFDSSFTSLSGPIDSGNRIAGTYRSQMYGEIAWKYQPLGFSTASEGRHNIKSYVNDINTDTAPSYPIFNMRAGFGNIWPPGILKSIYGWKIFLSKNILALFALTMPISISLSLPLIETIY